MVGAKEEGEATRMPPYSTLLSLLIKATRLDRDEIRMKMYILV